MAGGLIALDETRQANAEVRQSNANTHVRELYTSAIELLGNESIDVRLGGLYALERIANDSRADQRTVVEVVSAYVREHSHPTSPVSDLTIYHPPTDIQAALTILGRLPMREGIPRGDLSSSFLVGAWLREANLAGAHLDEADLSYATLMGADFTGAGFFRSTLDHVHAQGANFTGARLMQARLFEADLISTTWARAMLNGADLTRAMMAGDVTHAEFFGATFNGADLRVLPTLTQDQINDARGDIRTLLPDGLRRPTLWTSSP